jgi:hypothetical protein
MAAVKSSPGASVPRMGVGVGARPPAGREERPVQESRPTNRFGGRLGRSNRSRSAAFRPPRAPRRLSPPPPRRRSRSRQPSHQDHRGREMSRYRGEDASSTAAVRHGGRSIGSSRHARSPPSFESLRFLPRTKKARAAGPILDVQSRRFTPPSLLLFLPFIQCFEEGFPSLRSSWQSIAIGSPGDGHEALLDHASRPQFALRAVRCRHRFALSAFRRSWTSVVPGSLGSESRVEENSLCVGGHRLVGRCPGWILLRRTLILGVSRSLGARSHTERLFILLYSRRRRYFLELLLGKLPRPEPCSSSPCDRLLRLPSSRLRAGWVGFGTRDDNREFPARPAHLSPRVRTAFRPVQSPSACPASHGDLRENPPRRRAARVRLRSPPANARVLLDVGLGELPGASTARSTAVSSSASGEPKRAHGQLALGDLGGARRR